MRDDHATIQQTRYLTTTQMESLMPASKISTLTQGMFNCNTFCRTNKNAIGEKRKILNSAGFSVQVKDFPL